METGEMPQQLREWTAYRGPDFGSKHAHQVTLSCLELQFQEDPVPLACAHIQMHVCITSHGHMHACIIKNKYFLKAN